MIFSQEESDFTAHINNLIRRKEPLQGNQVPGFHFSLANQIEILFELCNFQ